jgi:hypothetical protein
MSAISRCRVAWTGTGVVGGGISTFYTEGDPLQLQLALKTFYASLSSRIPTTVTVTVPAAGETLESTTGLLTGAWAAGTPGTTTGASPDTFAAGVGTRVVWETAGITRGRHVRGATYLVPLRSAMFDSDGSINDTVRAAIQTAAQAVVVALGDDLVVWSRPIGGVGGMIWTVQGASVPDRVSWLRSRRT